MFASISKKPLWVSLLIALGIIALLVFGFFSSLDFFTRHGDEVEIPNVTGKSLAEATKMLEGQGFNVSIQDSIYRDTIAPLAVIKQFPESESRVKANRTVYLTVNRAIPPDVVMPNLVGMSVRNAAIVLKQFGLKMGDTSYRPDFAKNSVLVQLHKGKEIKAGVKLPMGTSISLVLGSGLSNIDMAVPDLIGLTYADARDLLQTSGISFGAKVLDPDVKDTTNAFIYRQSPDRSTIDRKVNRIRPGQMIDIWLSLKKPVRDTSAQQQRVTTPVENNY
ncbi:PASTA domain-containing protein [Flavihumibacter sp. UBA7668]|uniref:PASTA domain-containing protein n=1 Tax=Flavihumibacter sp. UBA7668 TaxID=1946542 RepID=UPI0025C352EE|nr:PASTA domain-containing protein [Flavihumibacter sp. UBA7668]